MEILNYPHPSLRFKTEAIKRVDTSFRQCAEDMIDIMSDEKGVGLSANQVGLPFRMFVVDWHGSKHCFINPVLRAHGKRTSKLEGCMSFPDLGVKVKRPSKCHFTAWALSGDDIDEEVTGDLCRILQHEMDHLDGILFTDRLSDTEFNNPRLKSFLLEMEQAFVKYPRDFDIGTFHELRYQYCGKTRPVVEETSS